MPLSPNDRQIIDRNFPINPLSAGATDTQGNRIRRGSDLLFPILCVDHGVFVSQTTNSGLNVNITGGFATDASGTYFEIKPQTAYGTFTAPASGKSQVYAISFNPVTAALVTTAGIAANTGTQVAPGFPVGQIPIATVTVANGDTATADAKINNSARGLF